MLTTHKYNEYKCYIYRVFHYLYIITTAYFEYVNISDEENSLLYFFFALVMFKVFFLFLFGQKKVNRHDDKFISQHKEMGCVPAKRSREEKKKLKLVLLITVYG